jgi:signal transduction histidine kinase
MTTPSTVPSLDPLAKHLLKRREAILAEWRDRVDDEPEGSVAARLAKREFYDHIPAVLNELHAALLRRDANETPHVDAAAGHGAHRWQQGMDLKQMTREWRHLHQTLIHEIEAFAASATDVPYEALGVAREITAGIVHEGVARSVCEFDRLQQVEAEARARDLETMLSRHAEDGLSRGESMRAVSHDLRGSLSIIRSAADLLEQTTSDEERLEIAGYIRSAADDVTSMLTSLLDLARLEAGLETRADEPFDAADLMQELCRSSRPLAEGKGLRITAHGPVSLAVRGDKLKVRRVVQNLLLNALKYTEEGGVEIRWQGEPNDRWSFCVCDTGPGLPVGTGAQIESELAEATQEARKAGAAPACTAEDVELDSPAPVVRKPEASRRLVRHGEGIGLAIVRRLSDLLDATLEVDSMPGRGTTFRVLLPRDYRH